MKSSGWIIIIGIFCSPEISGQLLPLNSQQFFLDENVIEVTFTTDLRKLRNEKTNPVWQPAEITMHFSDTFAVTEPIRIRQRGIYRKSYCEIAALMLDFKNTLSTKLSPLKRLKLVGGCRNGSRDEILLLKEYLAYRIFNFISPMSFRVRLIHVNYKDSRQRTKSYAQYAFLIEDIKDLAARNNCVEKINKSLQTEATNRQHMNLVSIFQYMIGNTDWSVPMAHNMKFMVPKNDTLARPFPVPYDFDFAGLVNAGYAIPDENLEIKAVTQRVYRGFGRTMNEIQLNLDLFNERKEQLMFYLKNFPLLEDRDKRTVTGYIEDFYKIISNKKSCKAIFIDQARRQ